MRVVHKRCAGLDVHQKSITACVRVALKRKVVRETRVFGTATSELLEMADWLGQSGCTIVAMEATGVYWKPVWHVLEGHFELVLAQPAHIKNMPGRKSDISDAFWIADLLAHGLIRASFVPVWSKYSNAERVSSLHLSKGRLNLPSRVEILHAVAARATDRNVLARRS